MLFAPTASDSVSRCPTAVSSSPIAVPDASRSWAIVSSRAISCERVVEPASAATSAGEQMSSGRNPVSTSRVSISAAPSIRRATSSCPIASRRAR